MLRSKRSKTQHTAQLALAATGFEARIETMRQKAASAGFDIGMMVVDHPCEHQVPSPTMDLSWWGRS
jgi:hypothetical protein